MILHEVLKRLFASIFLGTLVLLFFNIAQLVLYIGILGLIGQGILFVIAGQNRDDNLFYQLIGMVNKPWTYIARLISPKQIPDSKVPFVAFCVTGVLYMAVTIAKIEHCISVGIKTCQ